MKTDEYKLFTPRGRSKPRPGAPTPDQLKMKGIENRLNHPQGPPSVLALVRASRPQAASKPLA